MPLSHLSQCLSVCLCVCLLGAGLVCLDLIPLQSVLVCMCLSVHVCPFTCLRRCHTTVSVCVSVCMRHLPLSPLPGRVAGKLAVSVHMCVACHAAEASPRSMLLFQWWTRCKIVQLAGVKMVQRRQLKQASPPIVESACFSLKTCNKHPMESACSPTISSLGLVWHTWKGILGWGDSCALHDPLRLELM